MQILFTDETNLPQEQGAKFFAYGGLFFEIDKLIELHNGVEEIRKKAGYNPGDKLKFHTSSRPKNVSLEASTTAKNEVIELCIGLGFRFIAYVVLHKIAQKIKQDILIHRGANHVIGKFNYFLQQSNQYGIVAVDRLPSSSENSYLSDKFCFGLTFSDNKQVVLDRIKLFTATCNNASHASFAMDIILGSFRYCINTPSNLDAAKIMMNNVTKLLWCERVGNDIYAFEKGLIFRPKEIKVAAYKQEYDNLLKHINSLIDDDKNSPNK